MRKAGLLTLGITPGVAVGYFLLVAYILNRVRPVPICFLPEIAHEPNSLPARNGRRPSNRAAEDTRYSECAA